MKDPKKPHDDLGRVIDLDDIISKFVVEEETFPIVLPGGDELIFKPIRRPSELKALYASAAAVYKSLPQKGTSHETVHPWNGFLPETMDEFFTAFKISELSVEPKIGHLDALKMLRAPFLVELIENAIDEHSKTISSLHFMHRANEAKKNLMETLLKPSSSASESEAP